MDGYDDCLLQSATSKTLVVSIKAERGSYNHADSRLQDVEGAIAVDHC